MKPSVVLKNHASRNLTNQRLFPRHQNSPLSSPLSPRIQHLLIEKIDKQDDQNRMPAIINFEPNELPAENSVREKSEKSFKIRKKRRIDGDDDDDDDEYEIRPNIYNVCTIKRFIP